MPLPLGGYTKKGGRSKAINKDEPIEQFRKSVSYVASGTDSTIVACGITYTSEVARCENSNANAKFSSYQLESLIPA